MNSYEIAVDLPDRPVGEILDGECPAPACPGDLPAPTEPSPGIELIASCDEERGVLADWWILPEPAIHFVRDTEVVVPDLAGWRKERMPEVPEDHRFDVVPDWVCEILSRDTAQQDRAVRLPLYARFGVRHAWLIDPDIRLLETFTLKEGFWVLSGTYIDAQPISVDPFAAVTFSLSEILVRGQR